MAAGDKIDRDFQYEFRDYLFGSGTDGQTETVEGILGQPSARTSDEDKQEDHGAWTGMDTLPGRTIQIALNLFGDMGEDIEAKIAAASKAFQVSKRNPFVEYEFVTKRPGHDKRFCRARARRCAFPSNYDTARGLSRGAVELFASDPRFYTLQAVTRNLVLPIADAAESMDIVSLGDFEDGSEEGVLTITGPATDPRIANAQDGNRTIRIDGVIAAGGVLVVDLREKTALYTVGGVTVDWGGSIRNDNEWWVVLPGLNQITYTRDGGNVGAASTLTLVYRDAWVGAA